jgi:hypothetical protein
LVVVLKNSGTLSPTMLRGALNVEAVEASRIFFFWGSCSLVVKGGDFLFKSLWAWLFMKVLGLFFGI